MSFLRQSLIRVSVARRSLPIPTASPTLKRTFASGRAHGAPSSRSEGIGGLAVAIGAVAVIVPTSLWFLGRGNEGIKHNDHDAQKSLHTNLTEVDRSKYSSGRVGGTLKGIDQVVSTKHEDVDSDLPHDALNHPVNREKIEKTMQLKPPTKRIDPIKSVSPS